MVDDCFAIPLNLHAKLPARDRISAREWSGTVAELCFRRGPERRSSQEGIDIQSSGCHGGTLLRFLSALRRPESIEIDYEVLGSRGELRNPRLIIRMGQLGGQ